MCFESSNFNILRNGKMQDKKHLKFPALNQGFLRTGWVWAKKDTIFLIHTNKIIIYCCKDLVFWPFKVLKYAKIDAKCIYFQLRKDGKN